MTEREHQVDGLTCRLLAVVLAVAEEVAHRGLVALSLEDHFVLLGLGRQASGTLPAKLAPSAAKISLPRRVPPRNPGNSPDRGLFLFEWLSHGRFTIEPDSMMITVGLLRSSPLVTNRSAGGR